MQKTRAKTAYGLLTNIQRLIKEEPKRYDQGITIDKPNELTRQIKSNYWPPCGTVGCVAGWSIILTKTKTDDVVGDAQQILGLDGMQASELFDGNATGWNNSRPTAGPEQHAKAGIDLIEKFKQKYRKQLKATRIWTQKKEGSPMTEAIFLILAIIVLVVAPYVPVRRKLPVREDKRRD